MSLSERARDLLVTGAFALAVGGLVVVGWFTREDGAYAPVTRGEMAPPFTLGTLDGRSFSLDSLRGSVVMLNIWATWCAPCRQEMPSMERAYHEYRDQGLEIVAVAVDDHPGTWQADGSLEGLVSQFVREHALTFPVLVDSTGGIERLYGVDALPTTFLIDRSGKIRVREVGGRYWDREPYLETLRKLVEEP